MKMSQSTLKLSLTLCAVSLALAACGGSGSGDSSTSANSSLVIGGPTGQPASGATVEQIQTAAATSASEGLGANLGNLQNLGNNALRNLNNDGLTNALVGDADTDAIGTLGSSNNSFLTNSLGLDDPMAVVTRSGDIITIDPDEQTLCAGEIPLVDSGDMTQCTQLASDLMVEINALTDETGVITYLFQNEPALLIGYSPMGASYEIRLGALQQVAQRQAQLSGSTEALPANLAGALRFSGSIANDQAGSEAGELALEVTQTLSLASTDGSQTGFSLEPSTVFKIKADEATGDVETTVNWGALQLITESGESDSNGNSSTTLNKIFLGGLSSTTKINTDDPAVSISNLGLGGVPLTVTINEVESLSLQFDTVGISLDDETGMLTLDGALGAVVTLNNMMGWIDDLGTETTATLGISTSPGISISEAINGSTQINGGSVTLSAVGATNTQSVQQSLTINDGDCIGSSDEDTGVQDDSSFIDLDIAVVSCD